MAPGPRREATVLTGKVRVDGLGATSVFKKLNGRVGEVVSWHSQHGKYLVSFDNKKPVKISPQHLAEISSDEEVIAAPTSNEDLSPRPLFPTKISASISEAMTSASISEASLSSRSDETLSARSRSPRVSRSRRVLACATVVTATTIAVSSATIALRCKAAAVRPTAAAEQACKFHMRGACIFGDACWYSHRASGRKGFARGAGREAEANLILHVKSAHLAEVQLGTTNKCLLYFPSATREKSCRKPMQPQLSDALAIFKPESGSAMERDGISKLCDREVLMYRIYSALEDLLPPSSSASGCSSARVPPTSIVTIPGYGVGSLQKWQPRACKFSDNICRALIEMPALLPKVAVEAVAVLHMLSFNTDAHAQNLMLDEGGLVLIDNGGILPSWPHLDQATFSAWNYLPCLKAPPAAETVTLALGVATRVDIFAEEMAQMGFDREAVVTLRIASLILRVGVHEMQLPLHRISCCFCRDEASGFAELSFLETCSLDAASFAGIKVQTECDGFRKLLKVEGVASSRDFEVMMVELEGILRARLRGQV